MYVWRDRELVMEILEEISGNRVNYALNTIGGVRRDLSEEQRRKILAMLEPLLARTEYYAGIGTHEPSFTLSDSFTGTVLEDQGLPWI